MLHHFYLRCILALLCIFSLSSYVLAEELPSSKIGIVIMHGKGGLPTQHVFGLATALESKGYLVANLEMPWSKNREYDTTAEGGVQEVATALSMLKNRGAQKLFVSGHSQGGVFALHVGGQLSVDGIIAIAPGGNVANPKFGEELGDAVKKARELVAQGKGNEKGNFFDYEGSKGKFSIYCTANNYLSWFDPAGAMNQSRAIGKIASTMPVLFIAPKQDYPGLLKVKQKMFTALLPNPYATLYEPNATHLGAPGESTDEIAKWMLRIANKQ